MMQMKIFKSKDIDRMTNAANSWMEQEQDRVTILSVTTGTINESAKQLHTTTITYEDKPKGKILHG